MFTGCGMNVIFPASIRETRGDPPRVGSVGRSGLDDPEVLLDLLDRELARRRRRSVSTNPRTAARAFGARGS